MYCCLTEPLPGYRKPHIANSPAVSAPLLTDLKHNRKKHKRQTDKRFGEEKHEKGVVVSAAVGNHRCLFDGFL